MVDVVFKSRRFRRVLIVLLPLIFVIVVSCSTTQRQHSNTAMAKEQQNAGLPKIKWIIFTQTDNTPNYFIKKAQVSSKDGRLRIENTKILYSGYWGEGTSEYSLSPDEKRLLIAQEIGSNDVSRQHSNLLLLSLLSGKTKTLRGDEAGYEMLQWSSDGRLISYVSPILNPVPLAFAPTSSNFQLISYISNRDNLQSYYKPPDNILYISAADGKWRRKLQPEVTDTVWIPGQRVIVYTSYKKPGLAVYSSNGKKTILSKNEGGGDLLLSGNGKKLLWLDGPKLRLFEVPQEPSKLLDPKAWKSVAAFDLDRTRFTAAGGLSRDGNMVTLLGAGKGGISLLAVLNMATGKSSVYSFPMGLPYRWSQDNHYLVGAVLCYGGRSADLAALQIDPASINHSGSIDWNNPQSITPQILLDMPIQTKAIMWSE